MTVIQDDREWEQTLFSPIDLAGVNQDKALVSVVPKVLERAESEKGTEAPEVLAGEVERE